MRLHLVVKEDEGGTEASQTSTVSALRLRVVKALAEALADRQLHPKVGESVDTHCQLVVPFQICPIPVACFGIAVQYIVDAEGSILEADEATGGRTCAP